MRLFFNLTLLITIFLLAGCIQKTDPRFKPGDDPFVRKEFERYLTESGIAYTIDADGFYTAPQESIDKMRPLSDRAYRAASHTASLEVTPGCALDKLLHMLDEAKVTYILEHNRAPHLVKTTAIDAKKYRVMETYAGAQSECRTE